MTTGHSVVLYVEDEATDAFLVNRAFKVAGLRDTCQVAPDGRTAIAYLSGEGPFADRTTHPLPAVVLLDLHLPDISGLDVLRWIRQNPAICTLPVVVFSSSSFEEDRTRVDELGVSDYWVKPNSGLRLDSVVEELRKRWLT